MGACPLLCRRDDFELDLLLHLTYRLLNPDYCEFDCCSMALREANLKLLVALMATSMSRVCIVVLMLAVFPLMSIAQTLNAGEAIQRIEKHYSATLPANTVDTIKAGDPSSPVTGIATTFLD